MPKHHEQTIVVHTARQMYQLVSDIAAYPDFIPWCEALRIRKTDLDEARAGEIIADMVVSYKFFREQFRSKVTLRPEQNLIEVTYLQGPFENLDNRWQFVDLADGGCSVDFQIDFQFKNKILQRIAMEVFDKAFTKMSNAFINRADELYG